MLEQVTQALSAVKIEPKDEATAEMARHYARLIDEAAPAAKYAEAIEWLDGVVTNQRTEKFRLIIRAALSEHTTTSDLGPKLLATLTALGMTPAAAGTVVPPTGKPVSPLDELRERRREREQKTS